MDFKLSYNWLKEFVDVRLPPAALGDLLSLHSVSVERMQRMDDGLDPKVVVGRIEKIEAHPNADKLKVASVSVSSRLTPHASRLTRVVCGGTNLREGMLVAFAPPGAKVRWHGQGELVELKPTDIRGVRSDGMICAASEIGLGAYFPQEGEREILDLSSLVQRHGSDSRFQIPDSRFQIGQPLAVALGLDDVVFDIEVTTNRPDLMSVEELAREVAAITGDKLHLPASYKPQATSRKQERSNSVKLAASSLQLRIDDRSACPRYGAVVIDGVQVAPSPWWMQR
ncbi:hypothetical protein HY634_02360, partial [Candidatus Uhrbacteria bacterium]|nr:hypothetical protein [Candidatus Uhrbacteria bacterium]